MDSTTILLSFLGGILPSVLWLEFWLREAKHHEPRKLILGTFLLGMISVLAAGLLEESVTLVFVEYTTFSFFLWAVIEEGLKYLCAYTVGVRTRFCDEPIDPTVYLITSALGFSAAENILFVFDALRNPPSSLISGFSYDWPTALAVMVDRFVGATVLHVIASGVIGIFIGYAFYKSEKAKKIATVVGFFGAVSLHTAFNSFIIGGEDKVLWVFSGVWIGLVIVIIILEKIKRMKRIRHS